MCSIYGWIGEVPLSIKRSILEGANERGRDGWGVYHDGHETRSNLYDITNERYLYRLLCSHVLIGNHRATPTTESLSSETNLQPYGGIVHNGVISNDAELNGGVRPSIDSMVLPDVLNRRKVFDVLQLRTHCEKIKGSYAIAFQSRVDESLFLACNYKPIYYQYFSAGFAFASTPEMLGGLAHHMKPYSVLQYDPRVQKITMLPLVREQSRKAIVSASSGLDSTTVAYMLKKQGYEVHLAHFLYACKAESREIERINRIAQHGGFPLHFIRMPGSIMSGSIVEGRYHQEGIEGTEFAHDWVSARNLLMLSMLTAFAETNGFGYIAFGGNLEESGAYPDNEQVFGRIFDSLLPYATQNGVKINLLQPVSTLMKHEIIKEGVDANVPYEHTWSCYGDGVYHCGKCGPCFMRKTAFERNGIKDPVLYETDIEKVIEK